MNRDSLRRCVFVSAVCLLSFPWLMPCVGIWSAAAINGAHDSITKRDQPLNRLPDPRLKQWASKPGPKLTILENQPISKSLLVSDEELSSALGGRNAPRPGTLVGKGASALVDGVSQTLNWVDPFTLATSNSLGVGPTRPERRLILCESPFVMLEGKDLRFIRDGNNGPIRLAKAKEGTVTIITPEGKVSAKAGFIHYRGPSQEVVLEQQAVVQLWTLGGRSVLKQPIAIHNGQQNIHPSKPESMMTLNFVRRRVSCNGSVTKKTSFW